jgi:hypothetical protein
MAHKWCRKSGLSGAQKIDGTGKSAQSTATPRLSSPHTFHRRTRLRFTKDRTAQLIRGLGREPTYAEQILISRICACEWDLRRIDAQLDRGEELSAHMARHRYAIENRLRLDLRELGLKPAAEPPSLSSAPRALTFSEFMAR